MGCLRIDVNEDDRVVDFAIHDNKNSSEFIVYPSQYFDLDVFFFFLLLLFFLGPFIPGR